MNQQLKEKAKNRERPRNPQAIGLSLIYAR
jgi:hypothetical protein